MNEILNLIERVVAIPSCAEKDPTRADECFEIYKKIFNDCNIYTENFISCDCKSILFSNYDIKKSNLDAKNFDILTVCHTDVVENKEYKMAKKDNIIYGRGVFDMKSFVIMALLNLKEIILKKTSIKYGVLVVSDEETIFENTVDYWLEVYGLKTKVVLDNDAGNGSINEIVEETMGVATVGITCNNVFDESKTFRNIFYNDFFVEPRSEPARKEVEFYFRGSREKLCEVLEGCMFGSAKFSLIIISDYNKNNIGSKYHRLYKKICRQNNININYITNNHVNDSRFFFRKGIDIISHQATGGDQHKPAEWLDFSSLLLLKKIQLEFLTNFNNNCEFYD